MEKQVYVISGMAADYRIYSYLDLDFEPIFIPWIKPFPKESFSDYASRLSEFIEGEEPILIGFSLGGLFALEIAKHRPTYKLLLINTTIINQEQSAFWKFYIKYDLDNFLHSSWMKPLLNIILSFMSESEETKQLYRNMISDMDADFMNWAFTSPKEWKNHTFPKNLSRLQGEIDWVVPRKYVQNVNTKLVPGAKHLMIVQNPEIVSAFLNEETVTLKDKK